MKAKNIKFSSENSGARYVYAFILSYALKKFRLPLDIITLTSDEFESGKSLITDSAKKGKVMSGTQYINCEKKVSRRSRSTMRI